MFAPCVSRRAHCASPETVATDGKITVQVAGKALNKAGKSAYFEGSLRRAEAPQWRSAATQEAVAFIAAAAAPASFNRGFQVYLGYTAVS